jgi:hypothetical protein
MHRVLSSGVSFNKICYSDFTAVTRLFNRYCKSKYNDHDQCHLQNFGIGY